MRIRVLVALCAGTVMAGCGDGGDGAPADQQPSGYVAQVASYDLAAESPQRFIVGLLAEEGGLVVGGAVRLDFEPLEADTETGGSDAPPALLDVPATFVSVASGAAPTADVGPRQRRSDDGVGVYEAVDIEFPQPGRWGVTVRAVIDGEDVAAAATFEVLAEHQIVKAGDLAPRTVNLLPGTTEASPQAVDSRATADGEFPDPELHELTVADAIASGKPTMVAVTTPTFCISRFCGPITDSVQELAQQFGDRANFVHIEVWKDFEGNVMNRGAAEWIYPNEDVAPYEPWVFLVDGAGTVIERWDNVANEAALRDALSAALR